MIGFVRGIFTGTWFEVEASRALKTFGALLSFTHILTFAYWFHLGWPSRLAAGELPICQPYFSDCGVFRIFTEGQLAAVLIAYGLLALVTSYLFLRSRANVAMSAFVALNIFKFLLYAQDYTFMGNYHYILFWVSFVFVFLPAKAFVLPVFICLVYFGAGLLKLNVEWLSGAAIYGKELWIKGSALRMACAFVVFLELVLVWGLILRGARMANFVALGLLVGFHIFSWHIVGFFYPLVMLTLLCWFPLSWRDRLPIEIPAGSAGWAAGALFAAFLFAQAATLAFPGDSALTGEGRFFSLNMFDARAECRSIYILRAGNVSREATPVFREIGTRIRCEPYLHFAYARSLCRKVQADHSFSELDWSLQNKRSTDREFETRVSFVNFCASRAEFSLFRKNDWIHR